MMSEQEVALVNVVAVDAVDIGDGITSGVVGKGDANDDTELPGKEVTGNGEDKPDVMLATLRFT